MTLGEPTDEQRFLEWRRTACPHPDMVAVRVPAGGRHALERLRRLVEERCEGRVPNLATYLPLGGVDQVPVEACLDCLRELHWLESEADLGTEQVLVDVETGQVVRRNLTTDVPPMRAGSLTIDGQVTPMPGHRRLDDTAGLTADPGTVLQVEERPVQARQFADLLRPLAELFATSLTHGTPVIWVTDPA